MIILTQPGIAIMKPIRISSVVFVSDTPYCLAEVPEGFSLDFDQMMVLDIDFWWEVTGSLVDASKYKLQKYHGGIVEGIMEQLNLSKEQNIAYSIFAIASDRVANEWQVWERSILNGKRQ